MGESSCGKTTVGRTLLRLYEPNGGSIRFDGRDVTKMHGSRLRELRRNMQIVFQDPYSSLNPRMTIRVSSKKVWSFTGWGTSKSDCSESKTD